MASLPKEGLLEILKKHGFHFKKKWGQNFILDTNLLKKIAAAAQLEPGECVAEIGPGAGTLTRVLAETGARVLAVEIDPALIPVLKETLAGLEVKIMQGDILKINLDQVMTEAGLEWPYKIVANLPYYITTPVLMDLLEKDYHIDLMVLMVQLEVAERLTAPPGGKECGAISLAVQYYTEPKILFKVSRHLFNPAPEVDSAVLFLKRRPNPPVNVYNPPLMFKIIKAAFGQRRKTLLNALSSLDGSSSKAQILDLLGQVGIDSQRRGETLSLEEYARLANAWQEMFL